MVDTENKKYYNMDILTYSKGALPMKRTVAIITALVLCLCVLPMAAFAADDVTLYLKPNDNWLKDGARFAAYTWDIGEAWFDLTDSDNDGYYEVKVPANIKNIIFCRMNPNASANNWNNKWNQTSDLVIPADGGNCYTVAEGTWDKGNGKWSVFGATAPSEPEPEPDPVYVVAGSAGLCGSEWNGSDANNQMTKNDDGTYTKTYKNVPAGTYEFKIVLNGGIWIPDGMGNNQIIQTATAGDVTITFNPADNSITVTATGAPTEDRYVVAGSAGLCGSEWAAADEANLMTETSDGVYAITYKNVAAGEYELKVVKNGTEWIGGSDGNNVVVTVSKACDVTVTYSEETGIVVTGEHLGAPEDDTPTEDTPSTGDTPTTGDTTLFALGALMVLSTAAVVLLKKKEF